MDQRFIGISYHKISWIGQVIIFKQIQNNRVLEDLSKTKPSEYIQSKCIFKKKKVPAVGHTGQQVSIGCWDAGSVPGLTVG